MRFLISTLIIPLLVACTTPVPNSGVGVGFDGYSDYENRRAEREAQLSNSIGSPSPREISREVVAGGTPAATPTVTSSGPVSALRPAQNNSGISDEQEFSAVSSRETIESDRQRLEAQQQAYQTIQPTALPTRRGGSGPSIVEFALSTTNRKGQSVYKRSSIGSGQARFARACAKFPSSDYAQTEFLKAGGPKRDRKGLDPDGDGFACYWDPAPFRQAVR